MPRRANRKGVNAIVEIQRIAKQLRKRNPNLNKLMQLNKHRRFTMNKNRAKNLFIIFIFGRP